MDSWLRASSSGRARAASTKLDYGRFDKIVDSDDDDDDLLKRRPSKQSPEMPAQLKDMPPELKEALMRVQLANTPEDRQRAMVDLEARLQKMPPEFKQMFLNGPAGATAAIAATAGTREAMSSLPPGANRSKLDHKIASIERAQASLNALGDGEDPSKQSDWLNSVGITPEEIEQAGRAADPQAALRRLVERALTDATEGGANGDGDDDGGDSTAAGGAADKKKPTRRGGKKKGGDAAAASSATGGELSSTAARMVEAEVAAIATAERAEYVKAQLDAHKAKLAESVAEVERQQKAAVEAAAAVEKAKSAYDEVNAVKLAQGKVVDESVQQARFDVDRQVKKQLEDDAQRLRVVQDLRERGNLAMKRGDLSAARSRGSHNAQVSYASSIPCTHQRMRCVRCRPAPSTPSARRCRCCRTRNVQRSLATAPRATWHWASLGSP